MKIKINKNRGWRGLAEIVIENDAGKEIETTIFSFSNNMWKDLLNGYIVVPKQIAYTIFQFNNLNQLPKPTQQRSVLIKNFQAEIINTWYYSKKDWIISATEEHRHILHNYISNTNAHTTSKFNYVGIKVMPNI